MHGDISVDHTVDDDRKRYRHAMSASLLMIHLPGLDTEFRYWLYMESHPAHAPLPEKAHAEALDALAWTDAGTFVLCRLGNDIS